jgi:hypothetical protein
VTDHWAVTVTRNGENVVTIESNCLSGRELDPADEDTIRIAARHLLAFVGDNTHGELLAAAKNALNLEYWDQDGFEPDAAKAYNALQAAIAKAEESAS